MIEKLHSGISILKNKYYRKKVKKYISKTNLIHEKLGTNYGIGVIPENFLNSQSICYSAGAGEDISFEFEVIKKYGCKVHIFDPTPRAKEHYDGLKRNINNGKMMTINHSSHYYRIKPEELNLCFFYPIGIWSQDKMMKFFTPKNPGYVSHSLVNLQKTDDFIEVECKRLRNIMSLLGHQAISLLKLDIVGAEYDVIDSLIEDKIYPDLLVIEFDEGYYPMDNKYFIRITNAILKLKSAGYILSYVTDWNATFIRHSKIPKPKE